MKLPVALAAGFVAGIAFIVACHHAGPLAHAAPNDCAVWQYSVITNVADVEPAGSYNIKGPSGVPQPFGFTATTLPAGWEPMTVQGDTVLMRRCKP
jgi:hypothetical protein